MAASITYTFPDKYVNWPGFDTTSLDDENGIPRVEDMTVVITDGVLDTVSIAMAKRLTFDSLFINSDYTGDNPDGSLSTDWDTWNYFVRDATDPDSRASESIASGLYAVKENFSYTTSIHPLSRVDHPNGIEETYLASIDSGFLPSYNNGILTYKLADYDIKVGKGFVVGYLPWCANDVTLGSVTPVPEPATMFLLGTGLLGLWAWRRRCS